MKRASDIGFIIGSALVIFYIISLAINYNSYDGDVEFYKLAIMMGLINLGPILLSFGLGIFFKIKSK